MRAARNIAIIMLLALVVAVVPGGDNAAEAIVAAVSLIFMALIAFAGWLLFRQYRFSYMGLEERRRQVFVAAVGAIALMIAGADEMTRSGGGLAAWLFILGIAIYIVVTTFIETQRSY